MPDTDLYFEEHLDPSDKDSILALARYFIINLDELDELNKKDVSKLKSFISKVKITKRVSYGKFDRNFFRIASLFGSSNKSDLLADDSNTRWLIFKVINFKWQEYIKNIDPLQIWAQVVHELKKNTNSGELTREEKDKRDKRNNSDFLQISQERELLLRYFSEGEMPMTSTDVKYLLELKKHPLKVNEYALRRELRRLFGDPSKPKREDTIRGDAGHMGRYYYLKTELFDESINSYVNDTFGEKPIKEEIKEVVQDSNDWVDDMPF
jgi:predicted P-loop ATPase